MDKLSKAFIVALMAIGFLAISTCNQAKGIGAPATVTATEIPVVTGVPGDLLTETPPTIRESTPTTQPSGEEKVVTLDDQGKTVSLQVGERFLLELGEQFIWEVTLSDPSVVSRVPNILVVRGAQGIYEARQAGSVTLTAVGDPACRQLKPACAMPSILVTITIVVN